MVLVGKLSQEYPVNAVVPQGSHSVLPPPGIRGGMIFVLSARQGWKLLNFKSQGGDTFRGKMILGSQAGGTALS